MPMTWKTLNELLAREFRNLRHVPVINFGFANQPVVNPNDLHAIENRSADRVDAIVRDFARTRRWPALDEKERYFLRERLRFACEYASIAEISVPRPLSMATRPHIYNPQRRLVEWLLIDVWRKSGVLNWLEPLHRLTESRPPAQTEWILQVSE
jgi:hypothetical protein